jgi:hypothetical protein
VDAYSPATRRKPVQFTIGALLVLTAACGFSTCVGRLVSRQIEARGATAVAANSAFAETICILRVPESARNVDFVANFQSGTAAFDVSEADFLVWAKEHSWNLSEVKLAGTTPASWEWRGFDEEWPQDVRRIWYFSNSSHRGGWAVMYDRDRQRAYVRFAAR